MPHIFSSKYRLLSSVLFFSLILSVSAGEAADLRAASKSVVKLHITAQMWDLQQPWTKNRAGNRNCSGFFVEQGILTSAHCVSDSTFIQIEIPGLADKVEGERVAVNHQVDLALIRLKDQSLRPDTPKIQFGDLPELREKVVTIGYPLGGRQVSYTEGVVSRIDVMQYAYSRLDSLLVQTDAAINPGNSGGPVFSDRNGSCLGVATQRVQGGASIGYFVPAPVIRHFLKDLEDGHVDGIPYIGVVTETLENPTFRAFMKMAPEQSGVRVVSVADHSSAEGKIQPGDVLMRIDGHQIFNDGRVPFRENGKIDLAYYVRPKQIGESLTLTVLREGKKKDIDLVMRPPDFSVIPRVPQYDHEPRYYVIGGFVFLVVEPRYFGKNIPAGIQQYLWTNHGDEGRLEELVVISEIYEATVNKGYQFALQNIRVLRVNSVEINRLEDLVEAFEKKAEGRYHVIELENRRQIILDRAEVKASEQGVRARYNIRERSR